jgi:putative ABC transport system ATP-binding protein
VCFARARHSGFVFQTFNLISSMTAAENVGLPMVLDGALSAAEIELRATRLLERVGMGARTQHVPSQLSGGTVCLSFGAGRWWTRHRHAHLLSPNKY